MTDQTVPEAKRPQWIRQAVDFGALLCFAAAYFITRDMIKATWVLCIASAVALFTCSGPRSMRHAGATVTRVSGPTSVHADASSLSPSTRATRNKRSSPR